jgi:DNA-binding NtrC family response regulator
MAPAARSDDKRQPLGARVVVSHGGDGDLFRHLELALADRADVVPAVADDERFEPFRGADVAVLELGHRAPVWEEAALSRRLDAVQATASTAELVCVIAQEDIRVLSAFVERAGVDFVVRPFQSEELVVRVLRALNRGRARVDDPGAAVLAGDGSRGLGFRETMQEVHDRAASAYLVRLLKESAGKVARAARQAGLERESLHRLLKKHDIRAAEYRARAR